MEHLIPWLYLKGISTGDFTDALAALVGKDAPGLSAATISRLKTIWEKDFTDWQQRDLSGKQYVYFWVDGIHCNVRMDDKQCLLFCFVLLSAPLQTAERNGSPSKVASGKVRCRGKRFWWTSSPGGLTMVPVYVLATVPLDSGRLFPRSSQTVAGNAAGFIKRPMFSTNCQRASSQRPKRNFAISGMRTTRMRPSATLPTSSRGTRLNIQRPHSV